MATMGAPRRSGGHRPTAAYPTRFACALALLVALSACQRQGSRGVDWDALHPDPATGGTWVEGTIADADTLLPLVATDSASYAVIDLVYCKLLRYDGNLQIVGDLARRYEVLDGGLRLRFYLDPRAHWHDGTPITAEDVVFTVETLLDERFPSPYKSSFAVIDSVTAPSPYIVEVRYREPFAPALESWATTLYLLPRHVLKGQEILTSPLARKPVGCGPYRLIRWEAEREMVLERVADAYRTAFIQRVVLKVIPDPAAMWMNLINQSIDQMGLTPEQYTYQTRQRRFRDNFEAYTYIGFSYTYLGFNLRRPRFADRRIRRALAHAVDKHELIDGVLLGRGQIATGPFRPGMWYYNPRVSDPEFDPDRARALLAEAGWRDTDGDGILDKDGAPFRFTILTNQGNPQRKKVGEILQRRFREIGVAVDLRILEWSTFLNEFVDKGRFDAVILGWNTGIDPDQYDIWHSSKTGPKEFNFIGYRNPEVDRLLERGRRTFDQAERAKIYQRIHAILAWDQPYIFLYVPEAMVAVHKRVRGVAPAPAGIAYNFEEWWIPKPFQGLHE